MFGKINFIKCSSLGFTNFFHQLFSVLKEAELLLFTYTVHKNNQTNSVSGRKFVVSGFVKQISKGEKFLAVKVFFLLEIRFVEMIIEIE